MAQGAQCPGPLEALQADWKFWILCEIRWETWRGFKQEKCRYPVCILKYSLWLPRQEWDGRRVAGINPGILTRKLCRHPARNRRWLDPLLSASMESMDMSESV